MRVLLLIGAGSFIGGAFRFLLSQFIQNKLLSVFPFGTLGVNIAGCFAIGLIVGISERSGMPEEWRLFLATGICGGFTTFSAFSSETLGMLRDGQFGYSLIYVAASIIMGLLATIAGLFISKLF